MLPAKNEADEDATALYLAGLESHPRKLSFTSRDLLIGIALLAAVLGAYITFGLLGAAPALFAVALALLYLGRRYKHHLASLAALFLIGPAVLSLLAALVAFLVFGIGPRFNSARWPREIREIAALGHSDFARTKVTCHADFLDDEFAWRQRIAPAAMDAVSQKFAPVKLQPNEVPDWYFNKFPLWWRPGNYEQCRFFANGTPRESFGGEYEESRIMMYDPESQYLYVWQYWEF